VKNKPWFNVLVAAAMLSLACSLVTRPLAAPTEAPTPPSPAQRQLSVFDAAFAAVRDQYVRSDYGGVDWKTISAQYRSQVAAGQTDDAFNQTLRDMLSKLPAGAATFQTRAERLALDTTASSSYYGIGAFVSYRQTPQPHIVILSTITGSPAEQAGLQPHDSLIAVDGAPFTADDELAPTKRIRGSQGTTVTLTVQTPGEQARQIQLERAPITATDSLRGGNLTSVNVAYYRVPVTADTHLAAAIAGDLASINGTTKLKGIILDLRIARSDANGWPLSQMLTLFGSGKLGEFYTRTGATPVEVTGQDVGGSQTVPMVILVGSDTAGTPEVFAAALQASHRAVVVGMPTAGAVLGFDDIALPDGSRLSLATSSFKTATNLDMATSGLTPDHVINADWDSYTIADDPILQEGLTLLSIQQANMCMRATVPCPRGSHMPSLMMR
jgi:carboxyl-terminal processing protease